MDRLNQWLSLAANIGVIAGIIFLGVEIQQNTRSIDESRSLAEAQAFQSRSDSARELNFGLINTGWTEIVPKLRELGFPENVDALEEIEPDERIRIRLQESSRWIVLDNLHYQYQQGYLDEEYYQHKVVCSIRRNEPYWEKLSVFRTNVRPSFTAEIERIMRDVKWC